MLTEMVRTSGSVLIDDLLAGYDVLLDQPNAATNPYRLDVVAFIRVTVTHNETVMRKLASEIRTLPDFSDKFQKASKLMTLARENQRLTTILNMLPETLA